MSSAKSLPGRRAVIVCIMLLIAAAHVIGFGRYLQGEYYRLYCSYFSDIVMPFGFYFLFCQAELQGPVLRRWETKLALTFLLPAIAETCQFFGIPVLGSTFDPLDYLMYAIGASAAAVVETQVFSRVFHFWPIRKVER